jgi:MFS family permease
MGSQSAIFGPIKYAILPQHLQQSELVQGNALVETGTFLAILLGTLGAGIIASSLYSSYIVAVLCVLFAIIGYISSLFIPTATSDKIAEKVSFNPILHTKNTLKIAHSDNLIFLSIMGISWFWFLGASYLTQFPNFTKMYLHGSEGAVSILLALFSIGIAIGSLLCNKISKGKLEPGIVPLGSIGITIFGANLYWFTPEQTSGMLNAAQFITSIELLPLFISLLLLGVSGGIYIVPLYTMIQQRARTDQRAQVIAANNIYNAIFMVVSAVLAIVFLHQLQLSIPLFFGALALGNIVIAGFLFYQTPTFNERLFTLLKMKS